MVISVESQMERFVSVASDRNVRERFWRWSALICRAVQTEIRCSIFTNGLMALLLFSRFHLCRDSRKE